MNNRHAIRMALLGATAIIGAGSALDAVALTVGGTIGVTATVVNNCAFSTTPVTFGNYDPAVVNAAGGADLTGSGTLLVTCTTGDSISIDLDAGASPASGNSAAVPLRQMVFSTTNFLGYSLFWPSAAGAGGTVTATVWGTGVGSSFGYSATGVQQTINVFGSVAKGQNVPAGSYSDTVNVVVNF
jgi:spore coat protein U-like protein